MKKVLILLLLSGCAGYKPQPRFLEPNGAIMDIPKGTMIGDVEAPEHGYYIGDSISEAYLEMQEENRI